MKRKVKSFFLKIFFGSLLVSTAAFPGIRILNYSERTLSFGPNGERIDLGVKFRPEFLTKVGHHLKDPVMNVWMTEKGFCFDSDEKCREESQKIPHCQVSAERSGFPGSPLLSDKNEYSPMVNVNFQIGLKTTETGIIPVGVDAHLWKMVDAKTQTTLIIECGAGTGHKPAEFTKNLFQRILGDSVDVQFISVVEKPNLMVDGKDKKMPTVKGHVVQ